MLVSAISNATPANGSSTPVTTTPTQTPAPTSTASNFSRMSFSGNGQLIKPKNIIEVLKETLTAAKVKLSQFTNGQFVKTLRNIFGC